LIINFCILTQATKNYSICIVNVHNTLRPFINHQQKSYLFGERVSIKMGTSSFFISTRPRLERSSAECDCPSFLILFHCQSHLIQEARPPARKANIRRLNVKRSTASYYAQFWYGRSKKNWVGFAAEGAGPNLVWSLYFKPFNPN
jgi:hypothetical protein